MVLWALAVNEKLVQRAANLRDLPLTNVCVHFSRFAATVAQQFLDVTQVRPGLQEMSRKQAHNFVLTHDIGKFPGLLRPWHIPENHRPFVQLNIQIAKCIDHLIDGRSLILLVLRQMQKK